MEDNVWRKLNYHISKNLPYLKKISKIRKVYKIKLIENKNENLRLGCISRHTSVHGFYP